MCVCVIAFAISISNKRNETDEYRNNGKKNYARFHIKFRSIICHYMGTFYCTCAFIRHSMPDRRETNNGVESWMQIVRSKYRHQLGLDQFYDLVVFWFFSNSLSMFAPFEWFRRVCSSSHVLRPPLLSLVTFHEHRVEHKCLAIRYRLL